MKFFPPFSRSRRRRNTTLSDWPPHLVDHNSVASSRVAPSSVAVSIVPPSSVASNSVTSSRAASNSVAPSSTPSNSGPPRSVSSTSAPNSIYSSSVYSSVSPDGINVGGPSYTLESITQSPPLPASSSADFESHRTSGVLCTDSEPGDIQPRLFNPTPNSLDPEDIVGYFHLVPSPFHMNMTGPCFILVYALETLPMQRSPTPPLSDIAIWYDEKVKEGQMGRAFIGSWLFRVVVAAYIPSGDNDSDDDSESEHDQDKGQGGSSLPCAVDCITPRQTTLAMADEHNQQKYSGEGWCLSCTTLSSILDESGSDSNVVDEEGNGEYQSHTPAGYTPWATPFLNEEGRLPYPPIPDPRITTNMTGVPAVLPVPYQDPYAVVQQLDWMTNMAGELTVAIEQLQLQVQR